MASDLAAAYKAFQSKRYAEAASGFESYLREHPRDVRASYYGALSYQYLGKTSSALALYRRVALISPESQMGSYATTILQRLDPSFVKTTTEGKTGDKKDESKSKSAAGLKDPKTGLRKPWEERKRDTSKDVIPNVARIYCRKIHKSDEVDVSINGVTVPMMLDTGAPTSIVSRYDVRGLNINFETRPYDTYSGGVDLVNRIGCWIIPVTIQVGPIIKRDFDLRVMDGRTSPLLGQDFYKEFDLTRDGTSFVFTKKGFYKNFVGGSSIPFRFMALGNRIIVDVEINGKKHPVILDTGNSAAALHFHSLSQCKKYGITIPSNARMARNMGSAGVTSVIAFHMPGSIKLGPIERRNPYITVNLTGDVLRSMDQARQAAKKAKLEEEKEENARLERLRKSRLGGLAPAGKKAESKEESKKEEKPSGEKPIEEKTVEELTFDDVLPLLGQDFLQKNRYTIDTDKKLIHFSL
ncbi:MAG: retroviral-like aspartic protease family protein [Candidatus Obscuribacterales bacterium]